MGVGVVVGGYCPGTSFCGAAIGKIAAIVFSLGGMLGVLLFGEAFPLVRDFYKAGSLGDLKVFAALGMSQGAFALLLIAVAVAAFVVTTRIELKVNPSAPAKGFPARSHGWRHLAFWYWGCSLLSCLTVRRTCWQKPQTRVIGTSARFR